MTENIKDRLKSLLNHQWIYSSWRFLRFVVLRFIEDACTYRASALTFTTLLAIVPLMSVTITILSAFPTFTKMMLPAQNFIFTNFVPETGKIVQQYLLTFAQQATRLSVTGIAALFVTSILMMFTIERALNQIWRVRVTRKGASAFLLYWAVISLTPLLLGLSLVLSSYIFSLPWLNGSLKYIGQEVSRFLAWSPFVLTVVAFNLLYLVVPNTKVKFSHAFIGAVVAAILFETAKYGFGVYIRRFNTYELIYGAFATLPLFFLWVYWVWVIVLLGAEIAHGLSAQYARRAGPKLDPLSHAVRWLGHLWQAQQDGRTVSLEDLIKKDPFNYTLPPDELLESLRHKRLVRVTNNGAFVLSRDLSYYSLLDLYQELSWPLPDLVQLKTLETDMERELVRYLAPVTPVLDESLNVPLAVFYRTVFD